MRSLSLPLLLVAALGGSPALAAEPPMAKAHASSAQLITDQLAVSLEAQFRPSQVVAVLTTAHDLRFLDDPEWQMKEHNGDGWFTGNVGYRQLACPTDTQTYVLLFWRLGDMGVWWRLLSSGDNTNFRLVQDSEGLIGIGEGPLRVRPVDLDGDGIPEVIFEATGSWCTLFVYAWKDSQLTLISPVDTTQTGVFPSMVHTTYSIFNSFNNDVTIEDLDGDGKAEVVVLPSMEGHYVTSPNGDEDYQWDVLSPMRVYHLANGVYALWKEVPADEPYPMSVPGIAVIHPGTVPLSEVSKSAGGGNLRVFVSHPAGDTYTADDFVTTSFTLDIGQVPLVFSKRWDNNQYPDLSQGNMQWVGVPVRQAARPSQGEWTVNPSDPASPSPDPAMEFHFLGPYLELRLDKSAVYPFLLQRATADFATDPAKTTTFVEVPISGKMKDGKLAAIGAIVCVKKAGPAK